MEPSLSKRQGRSPRGLVIPANCSYMLNLCVLLRNVFTDRIKFLYTLA